MFSCGPQVKKHVVQVISAMAHHGYLELEGGELLVRFIVQHCALPDTYQVNHLLKFYSNCLSRFKTIENIFENSCHIFPLFSPQSLLDCVCRGASLPKTRRR